MIPNPLNQLLTEPAESTATEKWRTTVFQTSAIIATILPPLIIYLKVNFSPDYHPQVWYLLEISAVSFFCLMASLFLKPTDARPHSVFVMNFILYLLSMSFYSGGAKATGLHWFIIIPAGANFLFGIKVGRNVWLFTIAALLGVTLFSNNSTPFDSNFRWIVVGATSLVAISFFGYLEYVRSQAFYQLSRATEKIKENNQKAIELEQQKQLLLTTQQVDSSIRQSVQLAISKVESLQKNMPEEKGLARMKNSMYRILGILNALDGIENRTPDLVEYSDSTKMLNLDTGKKSH